ncbi:MAG: transposase, partial [Muribaculaceae bacterium]|nr:transposase [Muribaculaceae bacterium]
MKDFNLSYTRRSHSHDYYSHCAYHIILKKADSCQPFSEIIGDARITPGQPGSAKVRWSHLGRVIADAIHNFPNDFPIIAMYCYCVMPDHVHILLRVKERSKYHLGVYISQLTGKITNKYNEETHQQISHTEIFQPNYTDKIIYANRSLDTLFRYIRENPHRLAMRRQYPQFFQRTRNIQIGEKPYEAYGNLFLLRNPDKEAVKISRKDSPEIIADKTARWLDEASRGAVLVSPFISSKEKEIRNKAEAQGAKI